MSEIKSEENTSSRHFHILFNNIKYISIIPLVIMYDICEKGSR